MQPARGRFARFDLDRQIASTFPAHWKVGPAPVFGASQPLEPAEWLALLILKAGDVESNPGPHNRKLPPSALTTQTTTLNSTTHSHATTSHPNQKLLTLLQLNINSITNKHEELKPLVTELQPDIITIQETKLKKHNKTPQIPTYSAIRTDRANGKGGGLLTYIKQTPSVSPAELLLSRETRRTLAQLRTNKSPLLVSYLFSIGDPRHPSPLCPLCLMHDHTSSHLFECKSLPTSLSSLDLWTNPDKVEPFLATWGERLLAAT